MASGANGRVLLGGTAKQRAQQSLAIKPLLFGALIGALVTQAFQSLFWQIRWGESVREIPFEDPDSTLGTWQTTRTWKWTPHTSSVRRLRPHLWRDPQPLKCQCIRMAATSAFATA